MKREPSGRERASGRAGGRRQHFLPRDLQMPCSLRSQVEVVRCTPSWGPDTQPPAPSLAQGEGQGGAMPS